MGKTLRVYHLGMCYNCRQTVRVVHVGNGKTLPYNFDGKQVHGCHNSMIVNARGVHNRINAKVLLRCGLFETSKKGVIGGGKLRTKHPMRGLFKGPREIAIAAHNPPFSRVGKYMRHGLHPAS